MKELRIKTYEFHELSEEARQKALQELSDINIDYDWWEYIFEDANAIGLELKTFDLYTNDINGQFNEPVETVIEMVLANHGKDTNTYKTAKIYEEKFAKFDFDNPAVIDDEEQEEIDEKFTELKDYFLTALLNDYLKMLKEEYDYQQSEEAIKETIEANEYRFTEEGSRKIYL